jgi:glycogen debranching enzyme
MSLLITRSPGRGTTWMNAKSGDWVITPRSGRPVEINALWYNAVRITGELAQRLGQPTRAAELDILAAQISRAFNGRFWNDAAHCCYDVVDDHSTDSSIRPNQLLAVSLPFAVLAIDKHAAVLDKVSKELLTPFGPRTLATYDHNYQGHYHGDVVTRDRALHQGSVHPWLLGQFITAQARVLGRSEAMREASRRLLRAPLDHMRRAGVGQLCELFDGDAPHRGGGATSCATSVGELLRSYVEDILDLQPKHAAAITPPLASPQANVFVARPAAKA